MVRIAMTVGHRVSKVYFEMEIGDWELEISLVLFLKQGWAISGAIFHNPGQKYVKSVT